MKVTLSRCEVRGTYVILLCLLLGGCNHDRLETSKTLNYSHIDEPSRLDPAFVKDLYEGIVSGFLYDGLVLFGSGAEVIPGLAGSWNLSDDKRTYTFRLREARFSNGYPVTSADVRYSLTRLLKPETGSDRKWVVDRIAGADEVVSGTATHLRGLETPDSRTVIIKLTESYPPFLTMLAMPNASIIPDGSAGHGKPDTAIDKMPVGSGPWMLTKWLHDQRLEFRKNLYYWGTGPQMDRLVYHVQVEDTIRLRQFEAGNFDIYQVGFQVHDNWQRDPVKSALTTSVQELRTDFIGFMNSKPALADIQVRRAITLSVNRIAIFEKLQKGRGVVATGPVPPGIPGYTTRPDPTQDLAEARRLLSLSTSGTLSLDLWFREEALNGEIARAVQSNLKEAGINITLVPRDQAALRTGVHDGQPDLYLGSWTLDYPDIENAIYPTFHSRHIPRQGNGSHFCNADVDRLLDLAYNESDPVSRLQKFQDAEKLIIQLCPWVPLFHRRTYYAVQPDVKGWKPSLIYNADRFNEVTRTPRTYKRD